MLAILALVCFILATIDATVGPLSPVDLIALGLAFLAVHFIVGPWPWGGTYPWQRRS
jgi:hypothetical protein